MLWNVLNINNLQRASVILTGHYCNKVFNGSQCIRKIKEEKFFEQAISIINRFSYLVYSYLESPNSEAENVIKSELAIDRELLGFKYWMIHDNPSLNAVFANDMVWNKVKPK